MLYCVQYKESLVWETPWYCYLIPENSSGPADILSCVSVNSYWNVPPTYPLEERLNHASVQHYALISGYYCLSWISSTQPTAQRDQIRRPRCVKTALCVNTSPALDNRWRLRVNFNMGTGNNARPSFSWHVDRLMGKWKRSESCVELLESSSRPNLLLPKRNEIVQLVDGQRGSCGASAVTAYQPKAKEEASKPSVSTVLNWTL